MTINSRSRSKPRAYQGELANITFHAREALHSWFREKNGTVPYHEIRRRLKQEFDFSVGLSSLSNYYSRKYDEIVDGSSSSAESDRQPKSRTIVIRIEVPAGCRVDVTTEPPTPSEGDAR